MRNRNKQPLLFGNRGKVLATLCAADDRLSGGQIATAISGCRSNTHRILAELVDLGIVRRTVYPSLIMFELEDNEVALAVADIHDPESTSSSLGAAVAIIRQELPQWATWERPRPLEPAA